MNYYDQEKAKLEEKRELIEKRMLPFVGQHPREVFSKV